MLKGPIENAAETDTILESESRNRILDVAEGLFAAAGYSAVGMRQLAASVGLSKSTLFHHFPTKRALYMDVLARVAARLEGSVSGETRGDPVARLDQWLDSMVGALGEDTAGAQLLMRALVDQEPFSAFFVEWAERD